MCEERLSPHLQRCQQAIHALLDLLRTTLLRCVMFLPCRESVEPATTVTHTMRRCGVCPGGVLREMAVFRMAHTHLRSAPSHPPSAFPSRTRCHAHGSNTHERVMQGVACGGRGGGGVGHLLRLFGRHGTLGQLCEDDVITADGHASARRQPEFDTRFAPLCRCRQVARADARGGRDG